MGQYYANHEEECQKFCQEGFDWCECWTYQIPNVCFLQTAIDCTAVTGAIDGYRHGPKFCPAP